MTRALMNSVRPMVYGAAIGLFLSLVVVFGF